MARGYRGAALPGTSARIERIRVVDGDSIECSFGGRFERVRLYGIDAPELSQPGGSESAENLEAIIRRSGSLTMEVMDYDHYDRLIGLIYPTSSHRRNSLNLRMVREGQAYAFTRFGGAELGIRMAEQDAKASRRGLWRHGKDGGERPWDYRSRGREGGGLITIPLTAAIVVIVIITILIAMSCGWI